MAQAGAAAAEALALVDRGYVEMEPNTAYVDAEECSGCKTCIPLCPYTAITSRWTTKSQDQPGALQGLRHLRGRLPVRVASGRTCSTDEQIYEEIEGVLADA